ncbi:hypothetical protein M5689_002908 [Euphorbia peplus]|nr:hypothetical protein M5689_002908 [Euphorbia peplus]
MDFTSLVWNVQGATNGRFLRTLKMFIQSHKPSMLVLVETKISGAMADTSICKIGFNFSHRVEARGFFGGIWVLWNQHVDIVVISTSWQFIHMLPFFFTAVYGSPNSTRRRALWKGLMNISSQMNGPWIMAEDFNAILSSDDRRGGSDRRIGWCPLFLDFLNSTSLHDLGFTGPRFTWKRGLLMQRLDRVLGNADLLQKFSYTLVSHFQRISSDHRPLLINVKSSPPGPRGGKIFRFLKARKHHPWYEQFVNHVWDPGLNLEDNVKNITVLFQKWNKDIFGNIIKRKQKLINRLNGIQHAFGYVSTPTMLSREQAILTESTIARRHRNFIHVIRIEGSGWCTEEDTIKKAATTFYKKLFTDDSPLLPRFVCQRAFSSFSSSMSTTLASDPSNDEIKRALFNMDP